MVTRLGPRTFSPAQLAVIRRLLATAPVIATRPRTPDHGDTSSMTYLANPDDLGDLHGRLALNEITLDWCVAVNRHITRLGERIDELAERFDEQAVDWDTEPEPEPRLHRPDHLRPIYNVREANPPGWAVEWAGRRWPITAPEAHDRWDLIVNDDNQPIAVVRVSAYTSAIRDRDIIPLPLP